ncbi:MAG: DUF4369 domain-containing protein [Flavobacteriaceae bacterium]|nr:DUF4369 domain-containing protein [Flavobacteriaceae bacterium]MDZ4146876.1 DUF4369 domain-containing protein [Flavobacteriaceae bacterium]
MRISAFFFILLLLAACTKSKTYDMTVVGEIKGLKKGTLYLQKIEDTLLVSVDSVTIDGESQFLLHSDLESNEVFYLHLDKRDGTTENTTIPFFGEKDTVQITSTLRKFVADAKIKGSEIQDQLNEFRAMNTKFNEKRLDYIKALFEAQKDGDQAKADLITEQMNGLLRRRYLYVANFAVTHKESEIAPYLALTEIYDAHVKLLDTINNSLTPEVKKGKYGKELDAYIKRIKATEPQ